LPVEFGKRSGASRPVNERASNPIALLPDFTGRLAPFRFFGEA
jgi:hypothetical protein